MNAWIVDFEKALAAIKDKTYASLISSIEVNWYGDFIVKVDDITYCVDHNDFSVWRNFGDWRESDWREVNKND